MNAPFCYLPYPSLSSPKHFPCCGMLNDGVSTGTLLGSQEKVLPRPDCFWECNGEAAPPYHPVVCRNCRPALGPPMAPGAPCPRAEEGLGNLHVARDRQSACPAPDPGKGLCPR